MSRILDKLYGKLREIASAGDELIERPSELPVPPGAAQDEEPKLTEGEDFYWEGNYMVLTENYLLNRGYCCQSGCRHCPYGFKRK
jgi:hypothetical protein